MHQDHVFKYTKLHHLREHLLFIERLCSSQSRSFRLNYVSCCQWWFFCNWHWGKSLKNFEWVDTWSGDQKIPLTKVSQNKACYCVRGTKSEREQIFLTRGCQWAPFFMTHSAVGSAMGGKKLQNSRENIWVNLLFFRRTHRTSIISFYALKAASARVFHF